MCGINGIVDNTSVHSIMQEDLLKMNEQMIHRGPDDQAIWSDDQIGLGFCRLAIINPSTGMQPLTNEDGTLRLICNGEIYNYQELRMNLIARGHRFTTKSDAEVLLHLYEDLGEAFIYELRGMFAFLLWDEQQKRLIAGRDPFGIKPLHYCIDDGRVLLSSEISSLVRVRREHSKVDAKSYAHYLTLQYVPGVNTMFEGIKSVRPGSYLCIETSGKIISKTYWSPQPSTVEPTDRNDWKTNIRESIKNSVKVHMQSDVPVGSFLSSGIDSTIITALMRQYGPLHTFSIGFEGEQNECEISRETAKQLDTIHHEQTLSEEAYFKLVDEVIRKLNQPIADPSAIPLYALCKMAKEKVTVVLSGEGADELFAGYRIYQEPEALKAIASLPDVLKKPLRHALSKLPSMYGVNYLQRACTPLDERFVGNAKIFHDDKSSVLNKRLINYNLYEEMSKFYEEARNWNDVQKMQHIDMNFWLPGDILVKGDRMSMANSLELRVPFLDMEVYNVARATPTRWLIDKGTTKRLLREAFADIVPEHVLHRPKLGFPVPLRKWLKGDRGTAIVERIAASNVGDFVDLHYVEQLLHEHQVGKKDNSRKLWVIYVFAVWFEQQAQVIESNEKLIGKTSARL
ncbi:hypothetical protein DH09_18130 [Bacillaceae bacterium JMAK1]|nr:hypothetical protein DH09_18130 [Bacillaceae bacterium JMAK1]